MSTPSTYKNAGVNIDAGNSLVNNIKDLAKQTQRPEVLSGIGGFSGLFSLCQSQIQNPVLVASTDGVGTKLKLALDCQIFDGLGQDLVAMCVNDLICCGAEPLFFLDYYATGKLEIAQATQIINSISRSLKSINCTLLGGETAEMPGLYQSKDFDIAGFAVGIVDKNKIIDGSKVQFGDKIIGLASSGFHSNGYSLVRKIINDKNLNVHTTYPFAKESLAKLLLEPTKLYVNPILEILKKFEIKAVAHITGGGLVENVPRVLPEFCIATFEKAKIQTPELFRFFQEKGQIEESEMWRVFNMGIGCVLVVKPENEKEILRVIKEMAFEASVIGEVQKKEHSQSSVVFI